MSVKTSPRRAARREVEQAVRVVPVEIVDRFRIAAAHQSALVDNAYRKCRVYGMGTRPRA